MWLEKEKDLHFAFLLSPQAWVALHSVPVLDLMTPQYLSPGRSSGAGWVSHTAGRMARGRAGEGKAGNPPSPPQQAGDKVQNETRVPGPSAELFLSPHVAPNCSFSRSFLEDFVLGPGAAGPLGSSQHFGEQQEEVHLGGGGGAPCKPFASTSNGTKRNQSRNTGERLNQPCMLTRELQSS